MGLETATYISGLTETWPVAGDPKSQGDDHLRLIKSTLKSTFPNADKAFYFPKSEATSGTLNLDITDMNNMIEVTTTGGNVAVNLPTLAAGDKGWQCQIMKVSADSNGATVSPPSGTIASKVGTTATIRVGILNEPATFYWDGSTWYCFKWGPPIGSVETFDGGTTPYGYLDPEGGTYSNTTFAELFAVLATTTLRDRRGRVDAHVDNGANRLTNAATGFGSSATAGATGGAESNNVILTHYHDVFVHDPGHFHTLAKAFGGISSGVDTNNTTSSGSTNTDTKTTGITVRDQAGGAGNANRVATAGSASAHTICQPTLVVKKIVRAC